MKTKHRHSGPSVSYRTRKGRIMHRERPLHPITRKKEGRRGSRRMAWAFEGADDEDVKMHLKSIETLEKEIDELGKQSREIMEEEGPSSPKLKELEEESQRKLDAHTEELKLLEEIEGVKIRWL